MNSKSYYLLKKQVFSIMLGDLIKIRAEFVTNSSFVNFISIGHWID